jgi:hypothetical protein
MSVDTGLRRGGSSDPPASGLPLFPVGTSKFVVLSLVTFGIYELYWIYQNWIRIRRTSGEMLSPFWRTFFTPIWVFALFARIRALAKEHGIPAGWNAVVLATVYVALCLSAFLPDEWLLISIAAFVPMLPVQQTVQRINAAHPAFATEPPNTRYSAGNIVTIVIGCLVLMLLIVGFYLQAHAVIEP